MCALRYCYWRRTGNTGTTGSVFDTACGDLWGAMLCPTHVQVKRVLRHWGCTLRGTATGRVMEILEILAVYLTEYWRYMEYWQYDTACGDTFGFLWLYLTKYWQYI